MDTPEISAFIHIKFYESIYDLTGYFPDTREFPGNWLGVSHNVGDALCFKVFNTDTHKVLERSVFRSALTFIHKQKETSFPTNAFAIVFS